MHFRSLYRLADIDFKDIPRECFQRKDPGPCERKNPAVMFYYDRERNDCMTFYYHNCGGNDNRFETKSDCMSHCSPWFTTQQRRWQKSKAIFNMRLIGVFVEVQFYTHTHTHTFTTFIWHQCNSYHLLPPPRLVKVTSGLWQTQATRQVFYVVKFSLLTFTT